MLLDTSTSEFVGMKKKVEISELKKHLQEANWTDQKDWAEHWLVSDHSKKTYYHLHRWKFSRKPLVEKIKQLEQIEAVILKSEFEKQNSGEIEEGDKKPDVSTDKHLPLKQLAEEESLTGWNALIFLAWIDPESAVDQKDVLKEVFATNLKYDSVTLKKIRTSKTMPEKEPEPSLKKSSFSQRLKKSVKVLLDDSDPEDEKSEKDVKEEPVIEEQVDSEVKQITLEMKLAAVSAWCFVLAHQGDDPVEGLAEAGLLLESDEVNGDIKQELIRTVAQWVPVKNIPGLSASFEDVYRAGQDELSEDEEKIKSMFRQPFLEACLISALMLRQNVTSDPEFNKDDWPANIKICSYDNQARIRKLFAKWVVAAGHPDAVKILKLQLNDQDVLVREEAISCLGLVGNSEAREELIILSRDNSDRIRLKAVEALTHYGVESFISFASDHSHFVRKAVAEGLGRYPSLESALIEYQLITDRHPEVQVAATQAIMGWPEKYSIPIWGNGFTKSLRATRRICARLLIQSGSSNLPLSFDETQEKRSTQIRSFAERNQFSLSLIGLLDEKKLPENESMDMHARQELFSDLNALVNRPPETPIDHVVMNRLKSQSTNAVPVIEEFLNTATYQNSFVIYQEILPELDPVYKHLRNMELGSLADRRNAAQDLSQIGIKETLSLLAVRRLRQILEKEQDKLIWRYGMNSIMNDQNAEISEIAKIAGHHQWADIRLIGCDYALKHPDPQNANWLLPLFYDTDRKVRLAAIKASARTGNLLLIKGHTNATGKDSTPGLLSLLTDPDEEVRFQSAVSLCLLHNEQGVQELIRRGFDPSSQVREKVVQAMGESRQTMFVDHLIKMAWTEQNHHVKRAILNSLNQIVPEEQRDPELKSQNTLQEQIEIWARWKEALQAGQPVPPNEKKTVTQR